MARPASRAPSRVRRADGLVAYWHDDGLIVENYLQRSRVSAPLAAVRVLDLCASPRAVTTVVRALDGYPEAEIRRLVADLVRLRLLEAVDGSPRGRGHRRRGDRQPGATRASLPRAWDGWSPAAAFFHFSTRDVAFPRSPAHAARLWRNAGPATPMPTPVKRYTGARRVALPPGPAPGSVAPVLLARRTWREFARAPVDLDRVAALLHLTWAVQRWATVPGQGRVALKTSPSGGARHSGEVYVIARRVKGLAAGIYHYDPARRSLARIGRRGAPLPPMSVLLPGQPWYRDAPILFVMTAVFARAQWRYAFPRAYRAVLIEAGHLCQTFCLVATALGLAPFCSMAFPDSRVESLLGLEAGHESALYIAGAGIPPARETTSGIVSQ